MELGSDRARREDRLLAEIAEEHPDWTVERVPGIGWEAFPKDAAVLRSDDLGIVKAKLDRHRERPR